MLKMEQSKPPACINKRVVKTVRHPTWIPTEGHIWVYVFFLFVFFALLTVDPFGKCRFYAFLQTLLVFHKPDTPVTWLDMDAGGRRGEMGDQQAGEERIDVKR